MFVGRKEGERGAPSMPENDGIDAPEESSDALLSLVRQGSSMPIQKFQDDLKAQRLGGPADSRIDISLPVQISGTDLNGKRFDESVRTSNVSPRGAQLEGVQAKLRVNDIVTIRAGSRHEEFRVSWVGASLTPLAGQIGVIVIEQDTTLWDSTIQDAGQHLQDD